MEQWTTRMFATPFAKALTSTKSDPRFGCYFSTDELGFRLKCDFKPVHGIIHDLPSSWGEKVGQSVNLNFHFDIPPNSEISQVVERIRQWSQTLARARQIIEASL